MLIMLGSWVSTGSRDSITLWPGWLSSKLSWCPVRVSKPRLGSWRTCTQRTKVELPQPQSVAPCAVRARHNALMPSRHTRQDSLVRLLRLPKASLSSTLHMSPQVAFFIVLLTSRRGTTCPYCSALRVVRSVPHFPTSYMTYSTGVVIECSNTNDFVWVKPS